MPFCKPMEGVKNVNNMANPGTLLEGLRIETSPYNFQMKVRDHVRALIDPCDSSWCGANLTVCGRLKVADPSSQLQVKQTGLSACARRPGDSPSSPGYYGPLTDKEVKVRRADGQGGDISSVQAGQGALSAASRSLPTRRPPLLPLQNLKHKIDQNYRVNMILDNLPVTVYDLLDEVSHSACNQVPWRCCVLLNKPEGGQCEWAECFNTALPNLPETLCVLRALTHHRTRSTCGLAMS